MTMLKPWLAFTILCLCAPLLFLGGCGQPAQEEEAITPPTAEPGTDPDLVDGAPAASADAPEAAGSESAASENYVFGMSQCNLGEPWRVQMDKDIREAAEALPNVEVIFKDAQNDTLKQVSHVEEFISQGVDALIISPKEAAPLTGPIANAYKAGIPVIVLDRAVLGEDYTMFIGADNVLIGKAAGQWVAEALGGQGRIVELMGLQTTIPGHDRHNGFVAGLGDSDIEIIFSADMKWLQANAQAEMESALARFDDIDLVYAHNDPGAYGAFLAAKAAGRAEEMLFVGIDGLAHEGQAYVKQGILDATFEYPTGGKEAIEYAMKIMAGEEVPRHVTVPSRSFTPENIDQGGELLDVEALKADPVTPAEPPAEEPAPVQEAAEAVEEAAGEVAGAVEEMAEEAAEAVEEAAPAGESASEPAGEPGSGASGSGSK